LAISQGAHRLSVEADPGAAPFYRRMGAQDVGLAPSRSITGRMLPKLIKALVRHLEHVQAADPACPLDVRALRVKRIHCRAIIVDSARCIPNPPHGRSRSRPPGTDLNDFYAGTRRPSQAAIAGRVKPAVPP
jgi:hypothetical protein